jgi:hypothetical protein
LGAEPLLLREIVATRTSIAIIGHVYFANLRKLGFAPPNNTDLVGVRETIFGRASDPKTALRILGSGVANAQTLGGGRVGIIDVWVVESPPNGQDWHPDRFEELPAAIRTLPIKKAIYS